MLSEQFSYSVAGPSKPVEDDDNSIEDVLGEKPIDPGESKRAGYTCPDHNLQSSITNEARRSAAVEERDTIAGTTNLLSLPLDREYDDHTIAVDADGKPEETTSSETIPSGPSQEIQEHGSTLGSDGNDKLLVQYFIVSFCNNSIEQSAFWEFLLCCFSSWVETRFTHSCYSERSVDQILF